jgi:hypothetical protein
LSGAEQCFVTSIALPRNSTEEHLLSTALESEHSAEMWGDSFEAWINTADLLSRGTHWNEARGCRRMCEDDTRFEWDYEVCYTRKPPPSHPLIRASDVITLARWYFVPSHPFIRAFEARQFECPCWNWLHEKLIFKYYHHFICLIYIIKLIFSFLFTQKQFNDDKTTNHN